MPYYEQRPALTYYEVDGDTGPWVTLINGYSRPITDLAAMAKFLAEQGFRVLRIDNRGAGKTEVLVEDWILDDMAGDIIAVWDHLKVQPGYLVGISMGGVIAMRVGMADTARVKGLALVSTSPKASWVKFERELFTKDEEEITRRLSHYFSESFLEKQPLLVKGLIRQMAKAFQNPALREGTRNQKLALEYYDLVERLRELFMPTLIVHGEKDRIVSPEAAEYMEKHIPHAELKMFEGAGHLLLAETPVRLYDCVADFLKKVEEKK